MKIDVDKLTKKRTRRNPALDGVPGLARGLEVLEYLAQYPQGKTQKEIAEAVGLPAASASRITLLLEAAGYLWRDPDTKAFRHSMKMLMVGQRALFDADVIGLALPYMRAIRDEFNDTVVLGVLHETEVVAIENAPGKNLFRYSLDPGHRSELHTSAPGKALLAYLPEEECKALVARIKFTRYTKSTITTAKAYMQELADVRKNGYSIDRGEAYDGVYCVGAAIRDRNGYPVASIWITGPAQNCPPKNIPAVGARVVAAAQAVSHRLGYG